MNGLIPNTTKSNTVHFPSQAAEPQGNLTAIKTNQFVKDFFEAFAFFIQRFLDALPNSLAKRDIKDQESCTDANGRVSIDQLVAKTGETFIYCRSAVPVNT